MDVSIVSRVHNCADTVEALYERVEKTLLKMNKSYEIVLINDFSSDDTWSVIKALHRKDPHVKAINLSRHFGEAAALQSGFDLAKGKLILTISPTLENHPEDLIKLINLMEKDDLDLVVGCRNGRFKGRAVAHIVSKVANMLMSVSSGHKFSDMNSPFRLVKKEILDKTKIYAEHHKFLPALIAMYGGKIGEVEIVHEKPKNKLYTKYKHKTFQTIIDIISIKFIISMSTPPFSATPMRVFGKTGLLLLSAGMLIGMYLSYLKIFLGQNIGTKPSLILCTLLIIVGWLSIGIGLLGEMIVRIYFTGNGKISYHTKEELS